MTTQTKVFNKDVYFHQTGYDPHDGQRVIHADTTRHRVVSNGRRWGKSLMGGKEAEVTAYVLNRLGEPQRGWIVGPNYTDCEKEYRVLYDSLKALGVDKVSSKFLNNVDNGNMHIHTNWGWDVECRSAAHPETLVGEGLDWVLMVEAGRQQRRTWNEYIRPALSDKRGWSLHSGVPEGATDTSLLYALWQRGQDINRPTWSSYRMPSWTNTIVFPGGRTDEEILEAEADLTEDEFRRQYGAEFVDRVGRVMKEWDDEIHIGDLVYNPAWPLYAGVDYGYTNPFVWLWIQVDEFNNVYVIGERRWQLLDTAEVCDDLRDSPLVRACTAFYPDPAEPDDTETIKRELKLPARSNTGGELKHRLARIRRALKTHPAHAPLHEQKPQLIVDRSCTQLIWEMREGYRWPERKSEVKNEEEKPIPKNDHGPEALGRFFKGYFDLMGHEQKPRQSKMRIKAKAA